MSAKIPSLIFLTNSVLFVFKFTGVFCLPQGNRYCASTEETFFNGQCIPIGNTEQCPKNMQLFDGPNQDGFCDCVDIDDRPAFYSDEIGECHFHNTQGPCLDREWFVLKNNEPQCVPVPEGCPVDGKHFFGSLDESAVKECWELRTQGPCPTREILLIKDGMGELTMKCEFFCPNCESTVLTSIASQSYCRPGTLRNRFGHCSSSSIG